MTTLYRRHPSPIGEVDHPGINRDWNVNGRPSSSDARVDAFPLDAEAAAGAVRVAGRDLQAGRGRDAPPSANDKGEVTYTNVTQGISYTAEVLCAHVVDEDTARFLIQIPDTEEESLAGLFIVFEVEDNGNPNVGTDEVSFAVYDEDEEEFAHDACESGDFEDALAVIDNEVTEGNLKVHTK